MDLNWVAVLVAVLGAGGIGAAVREIASVVSLARKGVSGKEDKRRDDIIAQRDHALLRMEEAEAGERAAEDRADLERERRRRWQEEAARLRRNIIHNGGEPGPWPDIDDTTDPVR
jgi:hypothetical protein